MIPHKKGPVYRKQGGRIGVVDEGPKPMLMHVFDGTMALALTSAEPRFRTVSHIAYHIVVDITFSWNWAVFHCLCM